jgi:hypothetical protein
MASRQHATRAFRRYSLPADESWYFGGIAYVLNMEQRCMFPSNP